MRIQYFQILNSKRIKNTVEWLVSPYMKVKCDGVYIKILKNIHFHWNIWKTKIPTFIFMGWIIGIHKTGCQLYIQCILLFVNKADREKEIKKENSMLKHHQPNHSTKTSGVQVIVQRENWDEWPHMMGTNMMGTNMMGTNFRFH